MMGRVRIRPVDRCGDGEVRVGEDGEPVMRDRHLTASRDASQIKDVTQVAAASKLFARKT